MNVNPTFAFKQTWIVSLVLLGVSVATGSLFLGMGIFPGTIPLDPVNVRHAHSHLMFFSWGVLPVVHLVFHLEKPGSFTFGLLRSLAVLSAATYLPFLFFGYQPAVLFEKRIPLSVIVSTLNMIFWYYLFYRYWKIPAKGRLLERPFTVPFLFLVLSTAGAWGLAVYRFAGIENETLKDLLKHTFLTFFIFGWLVPSLLQTGRVLAKRETPPGKPFHLFLSVPLLVFASGDQNALSDEFVTAGKIGSILYSIYLLHGWTKFEPGGIRKPFFRENASAHFLLLSGLMFAALPFLDAQVTAGYRLFFLHTILAGFVSTANLHFFTGVKKIKNHRVQLYWNIFFSLIVVSRLLFTPLFEGLIQRNAAMHIAFFVSLLPLIPIYLLFIDLSAKTKASGPS